MGGENPLKFASVAQRGAIAPCPVKQKRSLTAQPLVFCFLKTQTPKWKVLKSRYKPRTLPCLPLLSHHSGLSVSPLGNPCRARTGTSSREWRISADFWLYFQKAARLTEHMRHSKMDSVPRSFKFTTVKIVKLGYF